MRSFLLGELLLVSLVDLAKLLCLRISSPHKLADSENTNLTPLLVFQ